MDSGEMDISYKPEDIYNPGVIIYIMDIIYKPENIYNPGVIIYIMESSTNQRIFIIQG